MSHESATSSMVTQGPTIRQRVHAPLRGVGRNIVKTGPDLRHFCEWAWGIIANAGGGDWSKESKDWQEAATKWRDQYHGQVGFTHEAPEQPEDKPKVGLNHVTLGFPDCHGLPCRVVPTLAGNLQIGSAAAIVTSAEFEAIADLRRRAMATAKRMGL